MKIINYFMMLKIIIIFIDCKNRRLTIHVAYPGLCAVNAFLFDKSSDNSLCGKHVFMLAMTLYVFRNNYWFREGWLSLSRC